MTAWIVRVDVSGEPPEVIGPFTSESSARTFAWLHNDVVPDWSAVYVVAAVKPKTAAAAWAESFHKAED